MIDVIQLNEFQNELLPLLISLYSSCGNYQIQSNLLYTFQNILLSPLLPPNSDCATEIQTLLLKELSVFIVIVFGIESNSKYSIYHLQGHRKDISALYSEFPKGICNRHRYSYNQILPKLKSLTRDEDTDVRFYSSLALEQMSVAS